MEIDLSTFHFLRPWWLLGVPLTVLLWWAGRGERGSIARASSIAANLLPYLIVKTPGNRGPRPIDWLASVLAITAIAAAGPAWQRDQPEFLDNVAPLMVAVRLGPSMNSADIPPTRLDAAKQLMRDLAVRRSGAKTGVLAYAGSSHLVLPPTDDASLLDLFAQALSSDLIAREGLDTAGAISLAAQVLAAERAGGTLLLLTDSADPSERESVHERAQAAPDMQVLVMAVGQIGLDTNALQDLARATVAPLGSLTGTDDDLQWIGLHAQHHFQAVQDAKSGIVLWKDAGYWLCWPLALLGFFGVRRGWSVTWTPVVLAAIVLATPLDTRANGLTDAFFTADQQGRMAFERGNYREAAALFRDPYWKGRAAYEAGDYRAALVVFSTMETAEGHFYVGNTQTRLRQYDAAIAAYDEALKLEPKWEPATVNREIVQRLIAAMSQEEQTGQNEQPDQTIVDKTAQAGQMSSVEVAQATSEEMWLRNLTLSPARFLRSRFAVEDALAERRP